MIRTNPAPDFEQILTWSRQIASGLNYLHNKMKPKIIHRDLKSPNVLIVGPQLIAKICDFGLGRETKNVYTRFSRPCGTPGFMAPEVIRQDIVSDKCDIYSFGMLLWEMISRKIPFEGKTRYEIETDLDLRPPIPDGCPDQFSDLIEKCWQANPEKRPSIVRVQRNLVDMLIDEPLNERLDRLLTSRQEWEPEFNRKMDDFEEGIRKDIDAAKKREEQELQEKRQKVELRENNVILFIRDSDPLCVKTRILTENSPVFHFILEECEFEEHDLTDFDPDAVRVFLTILDDKEMGDVEPELFREINKMAVAFKVEWLEKECVSWITEKMKTAKTAEDHGEIMCLFKECYFVLKRLERKNFMSMFTDIIDIDITWLILKYLSDFDNLDIQMINALLLIAGSNYGIFLDPLFGSVAHNSHLHPNVLHLLKSINLNKCFEENKEGWLSLFDTIMDLTDITERDLRQVMKLMIRQI